MAKVNANTPTPNLRSIGTLPLCCDPLDVNCAVLVGYSLIRAGPKRQKPKRLSCTVNFSGSCYSGPHCEPRSRNSHLRLTISAAGDWLNAHEVVWCFRHNPFGG